jgi:short-subunit dehydrogenase
MALLQLPFQGFYSSVKAALLSLTESLALELKGTGIQACSILPGDVATGFTSARKMNEAAQEENSPYKDWMQRNLQKIEKDELGGMTPEVIAKAILKQLRKKKMALRVVPRLDYKLVAFAVRVVPAKLKLAFIRMLY